MGDYENDPGWRFLRRTREQIIEDQSRPYDSKKSVWIPDAEEGYIAADIKATKGDAITVLVQGGTEKTVRKEEPQEMNPPKFEKTEDMSNLTFLNDASVLNNLRSRYGCMLIYTYSGLFCVVINPYKRLPIYTESVARMYMGKRRTEMPPHLFAVSDEAYRNMLQNHENQSMLITGESGAGKTENTKKVIAYFASVGASQLEKAGGAVVADGGKRATLEDQIVQTNPVLEAFGNAKTVRNNNSSRFGKFIRIHFSKQGRVASCDIEHYLLEKSRVIRQAPGERCYHIFYQLFSGYLPSLTKELLLDKPVKEYYFVAQAELTIDGVNDQEEHQLTDEAFHVLNFSDEEIRNCYKIVSAIMHMGNMKFKQRPREEQAETDGTDEAERASKMYGINSEEFLKALLRPRVKVGSEWVNKGQNMEQVAWAVGAMAKGLYSRMFHWLVRKCNETLAQKGTNRDYFIGVLDIAGFEIFDFNSFEQLWINFVNEKLQQFFNHHMFVLEQEEYAREGIEWTFIDFGLDLQACIELIEKPMGIIAMLDEECIVPKASDTTLSQKLIEQHLGKHPNFEKPKPPKGKQAEAHFAMRHYAGTVRYNVLNWLEKNKDPLNDTLVSVMKMSQGNLLLPDIWGDYQTQEETAAKEAKSKSSGDKSAKGQKGKKSGAFMTVSQIYRESLNNLMSMLNLTHPHFIRCIIPNEKKQSGLIDASLVLNQLTCNGVLEGIRICRKGFPNRTLHADFVQRYTLLAPEEARSSKTDFKSVSEKMLKRVVKQGDLKDEEFKIGLTKVFFKAGIVARIEDLRDLRLSQLITGFQAQARWYLAGIDKKMRRQQASASRIVQSNVRKWLKLQTWSWMKLYTKVRPMAATGKEQKKMQKVQEKLATMQDGLKQEEKLKLRLETEKKQMAEEKLQLQKQLESSKSRREEIDQKLNSLADAKQHLEQGVNEVNGRLASEEYRANELLRQKKKTEAECESLKKNITELDLSLRRVEAERQTKENEMRALVDDSHRQETALSKLSRENKQQEDVAKKLSDDLQVEQEKGEQAKIVRQKLQNALETAEEDLDRERRHRAETDKAKRKLEGELRISNENLEELNKQRQDAENSMKRREADLFALSVRLEEAGGFSAKYQRQLRDNETRIKELEEELESERGSRARSDRSRGELQTEIDEQQEQLDHQNASTSAHLELNKKKDAELAKIRREVEQLKLTFEGQANALKKKGADASSELLEQIEQLTRMKNKSEKEKSVYQKQLDEAGVILDEEVKMRNEVERKSKSLEARLVELRLKADEQFRQVQELTLAKSRMQTESNAFAQQLEELESQISAASRLKTQFTSQAEELKRAVAEEARERHSLNNLSKNLQHELDQLHESLEEEIAGRSDLLRQLAREQAEVQQWKSRYENEGLVPDEDVDEMRRKQMAQIAQLQNELDSATSRLDNLEKQRGRLGTEADGARSEADLLAQQAHQLEKKQRAFDKIVDDWRHKADDLQNELDAAQREARQQASEAHRLRTVQDSLAEQVEGLRRENRQLVEELRDLQDQLNESERSTHECEKSVRHLEVEKDELQRALEEAEGTLEAEEGKVMRSQLEVAQIRAEIEKRLQEKEEEFENTRRSHQRAIDALQTSLEQESKAKAELLRIKRKLEGDINELDIALTHANRANEDAQRNAKRYGEQIKELQQQIDEDQRKREEFREKYLATEKRLQSARQEQQELAVGLETTQRFKKQLDVELNEIQILNNEFRLESQALSISKGKLEAELAILKADLSETNLQAQAALEKSKKATMDVAKIAEELRSEQEYSNQLDRHRKALEFQIKDFQTKIEEAEQSAMKGGAKVVAKLEAQLKSVEGELESEQRRISETAKNLAKTERRSRELQFQAEEERKNYMKLCDTVEKLQAKIKSQRRQLDEAEESANMSLQKYRTVQVSLETVEERADAAETHLTRFRSRSRGVAKSETVS